MYQARRKTTLRELPSLARLCVYLQKDGYRVILHTWRSAQDRATRGNIAKAFAFVFAKTQARSVERAAYVETMGLIS